LHRNVCNLSGCREGAHSFQQPLAKVLSFDAQGFQKRLAGISGFYPRAQSSEESIGTGI